MVFDPMLGISQQNLKSSVILSEGKTSRSEIFPQSKDPYTGIT
jgi:hypothetical protein